MHDSMTFSLKIDIHNNIVFPISIAVVKSLYNHQKILSYFHVLILNSVKVNVTFFPEDITFQTVDPLRIEKNF